jgi:hypothetical protein
MATLGHALERFDTLDAHRVTALFVRYLEGSGQAISRAQAQQRMFAKLANPRFVIDMTPLLPAPEAEKLTEESTKQLFENVFSEFIERIPGDPWARTDEMKKRFRLGG